MTQTEALRMALELLAVATYHSPDLQAKRTEVIDAGLKALSSGATVAQPPVAKPHEQEPWGACVHGRVFVGRLPEHARKFSENEGVPIQWLYTFPPQRKPLTDDQIGAILEDPNIAEKHQGNWLVLPYAYARAIEAAHNIKE